LRVSGSVLETRFWTGLLDGTGASVCACVAKTGDEIGSFRVWNERRQPEDAPTDRELQDCRSELRSEGYCHVAAAARPEEAQALAVRTIYNRISRKDVFGCLTHNQLSECLCSGWAGCDQHTGAARLAPSVVRYRSMER